MAASNHNTDVNGPRNSDAMYNLKPYHTVEHVELPNIMYKMNPYYSQGSTSGERGSSGSAGPKTYVMPGTKDAPLSELEEQQEDVLRRLEEMQTQVAQMALRYKVKDTPAANESSGLKGGGDGLASVIKPGLTLDLVVSADPSSVPLSLVALCRRLSSRLPVSLSTFQHSSVEAGTVPASLQKLLSSNGGRSRADCQVAVTLIWKKVSPSPQLVVDPIHQTAIHGEANVARYLWALLSCADRDAIKATQEDELVDLAQIQVSQGNSKERAAAVRHLNSVLGKQRNWLMGGESPSLADFVSWSVLQQAGLAKPGSAPANVQRWLEGCAKHSDFAPAVGVLAAINS